MISPTLKKIISSLPKSPGIYKYYDGRGRLIYIGKATFLRDRVRSYFSGFKDGKTQKMVSEIKKIKFQKTDTVLEALILESKLIKKNQPKYNIKAKDDKSFSYFLLTKNEEFPRFLIVRETDLQKYEAEKTYGPYASKKQMEVALKIIRKIFPFHSIKQKTEKRCFDFQIGLCPGPYENRISKKNYLKNIAGIKMILEGKKRSLIRKMEKEMLDFSKKQEYEKAKEIRNQLFSLKHILDFNLIEREEDDIKKEKNIVKIEAYDISNISGEFAVGSLVVFKNNQPDKKNYRIFKIKTIKGVNDLKMMKEVLKRRFERKEWTYPDLMILDGGQAHLNMALNLTKKLKIKMAFLAVAKGPTRKKIDKYLNKETNSFPEVISNDKLLEKIREEAHRFAIKHHRKLRAKNWINLD